MNLRPLRPEGVAVRVEQGRLSGETVRVRPPLIADIDSRRYSVDATQVATCSPAPSVPVGAGFAGRQGRAVLDSHAIWSRLGHPSRPRLNRHHRRWIVAIYLIDLDEVAGS